MNTLIDIAMCINNVLVHVNTGTLVACFGIIVSLYVPIAILIYQEINELGRFGSSFEFDKTVLLGRVVKGKEILLSVLVASATLVIMDFKNKHLLMLAFVTFLICVYLLVRNLINLYRWFMSNKIGQANSENYRQKQRITFLNNLDPNGSLDVWTCLFGTINLEDAYLRKYLEIFFEKFSRTDEKNYWTYQICLTSKMHRLLYWYPDFQECVMDFVFDAFNNQNAILRFYELVIFKELSRLLLKGEHRENFIYMSNYFDGLCNSLDDGVYEAVFKYTKNVLSIILNIYDEVSEIQTVELSIFPIYDKWNISKVNLCNSENEKQKAMALFSSYAEILPDYLKGKNDEINVQRAKFLDNLVFYRFNEGINMCMIRIFVVFYEQSVYTMKDNEDKIHAIIRNFIDHDYGYYFMETITITRICNSDEEIDNKELMVDFDKAKKKYNETSLELIDQLCLSKMSLERIRTIKKYIEEYDLEDERYSYKTDARVIKNNLDRLSDVFSEALKYMESKNFDRL